MKKLGVPRRTGPKSNVKLPEDVLLDLDSKPAKTREFVDKYLGRRRFTDVPTQATASEITLSGAGWAAPWVLALESR